MVAAVTLSIALFQENFDGIVELPSLLNVLHGDPRVRQSPIPAPLPSLVFKILN